jgi:hypothetical protein
VTVAIGIAVPVVSALIAGFVAWTVANRQALKVREQWVLDKRHTLYVGVLDVVVDMLREAAAGTDAAATTSRLLGTPASRHALLSRLTALELLAPKHIRDYTDEIVKSMWEVAADSSKATRFWEQLQGLVNLLREDLVPEQMR